MTIAERLSDIGYAAGWRLVRALPESIATKVFDTAADWSVREGGPEQLRKNLARVIGVAPQDVPDELMRASVRSYARYWREAFRLPSMDLDKTAAALTPMVQGTEHLDAAMAAGKGAVLALPHSGNWDMAGVWCVRQWGAITAVNERLKPESLYRRFVDYRESLGFEIIPLSGGEEPPFAVLGQRLSENKIVTLLGERDLAAKGVPVTFFGEPTQMPAGPAKLAQHTGAALLPVHCWFTDDGWGFLIGPPIDPSVGVEAATQALADRFEANIAAHPADWHMLQPLWLADLSQSRRDRLTGRTGSGD